MTARVNAQRGYIPERYFCGMIGWPPGDHNDYICKTSGHYAEHSYALWLTTLEAILVLCLQPAAKLASAYFLLVLWPSANPAPYASVCATTPSVVASSLPVAKFLRRIIF